MTATAADASAAILINSAAVATGTPSAPIIIGPGPVVLAILVRTPGGARKTYDLVVTRSRIDYLKTSNSEAGDMIGRNVSLSGDTLGIGSPTEDSSATGVNGNQADNSATTSGAVYVFQCSGGVWAQQAYLKASNTGAGDRFGREISLSGDTLAVGASEEDSSATGVNGNQADDSAMDSGAVYVFQRSGGVWAQQAYLKASNTGVSDNFGSRLSLSGDTLAVGAFDEDSSATGVNGNQADNGTSNSGAVYVFQRSGGVWTQQAYLKASNTGADDKFGGSVSLSGDTLAVGAPFEDSNATGIGGDQANNSTTNSGAIYVFQRSSGVWTQQAYLKASNPAVGYVFGDSVSLSGNLLAVGSRGEDSNATGVNGNQADNSAGNSGAVYVFRRSGGVWTQQAYLKASNTGESDDFGWSVSLSNDTLAVGAMYEDGNATGINGNQSDNSTGDSGAVYVFR